MKNDLRGVIADVLSGVIVIAAIALHAFGRADAFTDALALIAVTYLGMGGVAAKTANGQASLVAANTSRIAEMEPHVAASAAAALAAASAAGLVPDVTVTAPAAIAVTLPKPAPRPRARSTAAHGGR